MLGAVEEATQEEISRLYATNVFGLLAVTRAVLPYMRRQRSGHVINISSVFGLFAVPGQAAYASAKFAVRGFTEALRQEMVLARHPVRVTVVHPGGVKTAIARNATAADGLDHGELADQFDKRLAKTSPERAARVILDAVRKNKARVLVGLDAEVLDLLVRLTGSRYQQLFGPVMGRLMPKP